MSKKKKPTFADKMKPVATTWLQRAISSLLNDFSFTRNEPESAVMAAAWFRAIHSLVAFFYRCEKKDFGSFSKQLYITISELKNAENLWMNSAKLDEDGKQKYHKAVKLASYVTLRARNDVSALLSSPGMYDSKFVGAVCLDKWLYFEQKAFGSQSGIATADTDRDTCLSMAADFCPYVCNIMFLCAFLVDSTLIKHTGGWRWQDGFNLFDAINLAARESGVGPEDRVGLAGGDLGTFRKLNYPNGYMDVGLPAFGPYSFSLWQSRSSLATYLLNKPLDCRKVGNIVFEKNEYRERTTVITQKDIENARGQDSQDSVLRLSFSFLPGLVHYVIIKILDIKRFFSGLGNSLNTVGVNFMKLGDEFKPLIFFFAGNMGWVSTFAKGGVKKLNSLGLDSYLDLYENNEMRSYLTKIFRKVALFLNRSSLQLAKDLHLEKAALWVDQNQIYPWTGQDVVTFLGKASNWFTSGSEPDIGATGLSSPIGMGQELSVDEHLSEEEEPDHRIRGFSFDSVKYPDSVLDDALETNSFGETCANMLEIISGRTDGTLLGPDFEIEDDEVSEYRRRSLSRHGTEDLMLAWEHNLVDDNFDVEASRLTERGLIQKFSVSSWDPGFVRSSPEAESQVRARKFGHDWVILSEQEENASVINYDYRQPASGACTPVQLGDALFDCAADLMIWMFNGCPGPDDLDDDGDSSDGDADNREQNRSAIDTEYDMDGQLIQFAD